MAYYCLDQPAANTTGDLIVVVSRVDQWQSCLNKLTNIMTRNGEQPLTGPVKDYYEKIVPMLMKTDRFGINNFIRRIVLWQKGRSGPSINGPVCRADHRVYGHIQASLAAENLMLSLSAHGYESCPIGGIDKRAIVKLLEIPRGGEVTMVIGAGTGKPEGLFSARVRFPYSDLVKEIGV